MSAKPTLVTRIIFLLLLVGLSFLALGLSGAAGTWVTIKSRIDGEVVMVPDLINMTEEEATAALVDLNLIPAVDRSRVVHTNIVPEGRVFLQTPASGNKIKTNRVIEITLSSGPEKKRAPRMTGEILSFGRELLREEAGVDDPMITRITYPEQSRGMIMAQHPPRDTEISSRRGVSLLVSEGEPLVDFVMPELVGRDYLEVKAFLERVGLRHVARYKTEDEDLGQVILDQIPKAGYAVNRGNVIRLTINQDF